MSKNLPERRPSSRELRALALAREEGADSVLVEFVPAVIESHKATERLVPLIEGLIEQALLSGDTAVLKDVTPLFKIFKDEQKRITDRVWGSSVQRSKSEVSVEAKVVHVSLKELMARRRDQGVDL
jgi:hypothetical protein